MSGPIRTMLQTIRGLWSAVIGQKHSSGETAAPEVVLHDPAAQRPHDLDDPFFDQTIQKRFAGVIAGAVQDKR